MALAARGSRHIGDTEEQIEDATELARVRRQALSVNLKSMAAGAVLTALSLAIPF